MVDYFNFGLFRLFFFDLLFFLFLLAHDNMDDLLEVNTLELVICSLHVLSNLDVKAICLILILDDLKLFGAADAATESIGAPILIEAGRRVNFEAKRAIFSATAGRNLVSLNSFGHVVIVAWGAEEFATACPLGYRAAKLALPVDVSIAMLVANLFSISHLLNYTLFADQTIGIKSSFCVHSLSAVHHASKVGLFALTARVDGALFHRILLKLVIVLASWSGNRSVSMKTLLLSMFDSQVNNDCLVLLHLLKLFAKDWNIRVNLDFLSAARAIHEAEVDSCGVPLVLEQLLDAVGVEDMTAAKCNAWLLAKGACVADIAQLVLIGILKPLLIALSVEAGEAFALAGNSTALMAAGMGLSASSKSSIFIFFLLLFTIVQVHLEHLLEFLLVDDLNGW